MCQSSSWSSLGGEVKGIVAQPIPIAHVLRVATIPRSGLPGCHAPTNGGGCGDRAGGLVTQRPGGGGISWVGVSCCSGRWVIEPTHDRAPLLNGAVSQKQIDQVLIRHPEICRHSLEVVHRRNIKANGDLALELIGVWVL